MTPGRRGLNLVRGDPRPPTGHREGAPLVLLPLLGDGEGRRAAIAALAAAATALACSIDYFFETHIMLTSNIHDIVLSRLQSDPLKRGIVSAMHQRGACNALRLYRGCARRNSFAHPWHGCDDFTETINKKNVSTKSRQCAIAPRSNAAATSPRP